MKKIFFWALIGAIVGWLVFLFTQIEGKKEALEDKNFSDLRKAPNFLLKDYSGNSVASDNFRGKNLVINTWAAWCPFCVRELQDFQDAQQEFGGEVVILAINRAESLKIAKEFSDKVNVTSDNLILLLDPTDSFYQSIGGFSMPETIFVNEAGFIQFHKRGPMDLEEIRERIHELVEN